MKWALRVAASLAIAAAAGWITYRYCYLRHVCNVRAETVQQSMVRLMNAGGPTTERIFARMAAEEMSRCLECWPTNINLYMIRAAALRMLDRPEEAALDYRRAIRVDRRAELYFNLGLTEMEAGRDLQAFDALVTAGFLFYPYMDEMPEPMQSRVRAAVSPIFAAMQRGKARPEDVQKVRDRVARDPL